jgi:predicted HicB family RNase H-like nuclease
MIEYKGYTGVFEFDSELELFSGFVVDLRDQIYFEGGSVEELKASMRRAIDHYLEVCKARGEEPEKPFSGKLNVRLGSDLHRAVAVAAAARGESINSWLIHVVSSAAEQDPNVIPLTRHETQGSRMEEGNATPRRKRSGKKAAGAPKK